MEEREGFVVFVLLFSLFSHLVDYWVWAEVQEGVVGRVICLLWVFS